MIAPDKGMRRLMAALCLENLVVTSLLAWALVATGRLSIPHWLTSSGAELDFVIELPAGCSPSTSRPPGASGPATPVTCGRSSTNTVMAPRADCCSTMAERRSGSSAACSPPHGTG